MSERVIVLEARYSDGSSQRYLLWTEAEAGELCTELLAQPGIASLELQASQLVVGDEGDRWMFPVHRYRLYQSSSPTSRGAEALSSSAPLPGPSSFSSLCS